MKVAIMQPAFIPPASYFRLFAASDTFVFYDDVQFTRRWFTHRQMLTDNNGKKDWLTLPLQKCPRHTLIRDVKFMLSTTVTMRKNCKNFPYEFDFNFQCTPCDFVISLLHRYCNTLDIPIKTVRSGHLFIPQPLRGQDRIIAICKKLGATEYINSPGGRDLYDEESFSKEGIKLTFLPEYTGSMDSIVERLHNEKTEDIRKEIYGQI